MVTKESFIYHIDHNDHSRVIGWWKNIDGFTAYIAKTLYMHEMLWAFSDDYHKVHGPRIDNKPPNKTIDQRFCVSKYYEGYVCKYDLSGLFLERIPVKEFRELNVRASMYYYRMCGYPQYSRIYVKEPHNGFYWDYSEYPKINTILHIDTPNEILYDDYEKIRRGEIPRINPDLSRKMSGRRKKIVNHETQEI